MQLAMNPGVLMDPFLQILLRQLETSKFRLAQLYSTTSQVLLFRWKVLTLLF